MGLSFSMPWSRLAKPRAWQDLSPSAAAPHIDELRVVDVRQPHEFHGDGHLEGAELVPLAGFRRAMQTWDRSQPILVVCRSGRRAAAACDLLTRHGFTAVNNLAGGMVAWQAEGRALAARGA